MVKKNKSKPPRFVGNRPRVERDIESIVARLRAGGSTLTAICREYHCAYNTLKPLVNLYILPEEWQVLRRRILGRGGKRTRFKKGLVPWNKGVKGLRFSPATEFKPGYMRGAAARNYRPIGTISHRPDKSGHVYAYIKVREDGPPQKRWEPLHRRVWEQKYGPIPPGGLIIHLDGNTLNNNPANLNLITRSENIQRNRDRDAASKNKRITSLRRAWQSQQTRENHAKGLCRARARRKIAQLLPDANWTCRACGADYEERPDQCNKCQSIAIEPIRCAASG